MPDISMTVESSGPVFEKSKGNKRINDVTKAFLQRMVELGDERAKELARSSPGGLFLSAQIAGDQKSTGNYRRNINSAVQNMTGTITLDLGQVVYGAWIEGTSSRNSAAQFPGYGLFRKTKEWMEKKIGGERKEFEKRYARRLNGI